MQNLSYLECGNLDSKYRVRLIFRLDVLIIALGRDRRVWFEIMGFSLVRIKQLNSFFTKSRSEFQIEIFNYI